MSEGVTQAAMPGAVPNAPVGRHARRDEHAAGAFGEALGAPKPSHRADAGAAAKAKVDGWRQVGPRPQVELAARGGATSAEGLAARTMIDGKLVHGQDGSPDEPDATLDEGEPAETHADDGMPARMRAEHAITAFMAIAPITRQSPQGHHKAEADGKADAADAGIAPSKGAKAGPATGAKTELEAQSQPGDTAVGERPAAKPAAQARGVAAEVAVAASTVSAAPGHDAKASAGAKADAARQPQAAPADKADATATTPIEGKPKAFTGTDGGSAGEGTPDGRSTSREARRAEPQAAARVTVISEQAVPAPAAASLSANGAAIVDAIGADSGWRAAANSASEPLAQSPNNAQPMRELKIQLHPLELGVVTAHLRTVGEKLSVELKVDNHDAYHRLSTDSDAIVKSLRALGFEIDSVTVQQPQAAATTVARTETGAGTGSFSRDTPSFQPGNSGSGGERFGGQTNGRGERGEAQGNETAQPLNRDRAGSSLYI